jgi:diguanylate cyclase (GGDEF)-like protein
MNFLSHWKTVAKPRRQEYMQILIIVLAYAFTGWLGLSVPFVAGKVTLFWLPSGIAVAALYRWSTRVWPGIFLGALLINLCTGAPPLTNLIIAIGNTLGPLITLYLLRRTHCQLHQLQRSTAWLFLAVSSLGMLIPASIGGTAIILTNHLSFAAAKFSVYLPWWMGDSLGVLLAAPLLINITKANIYKLTAHKRNIMWVFALSTLIGLICFPLNNFNGNHHFPIVYISFVCVAWAALSFGLLGGAIMTLSFSFMAIWSTVNHLGPFAFADIEINYWLLWIYTSSMTCLSLMITAAHSEILFLAFYDPLTQLPNRRMLIDRLKLITAHSFRTHQHGALLFIDIDHFKILNDTRGHQIGDLLLIEIAKRINSIIRISDMAVRLGGDEFVVVFDNLDSNPETAAMEAKKRATELHELLNLPYLLLDSLFHCTMSIGVNLFNGKNSSIDDLLRHADVAMYQAKDSGRNAIRFFDPQMQTLLDARTAIEFDLRIAQQSKNELIPYYQVQINQHGKAIGAELLLRWLHATKGMIPPAEFIPVAEQTGLILEIGKHVIKQACDQLNCWRLQPQFAHLTIAVNVSPFQFNQETFVADVMQIVNASKINPRLLKLELTESSLLTNVTQSIAKMQLLQDFGIGFSMDDFGIGYSSLSYLKRLPLYQLKIDQSFVRDIAIDANDETIVRTIIAMAQNMNLHVIAEGVETETQKHFLEKNGCLMFQGYYFGKPLPIAEFEAHILKNNY